MAPAGFRRIALSMPEAVEDAHMGHPDFRVKGRIFATLFSREGTEWGMVKLKPGQQRQFLSDCPFAFAPCKGAWGRQGATQVRLAKVDRPTLKSAIFTAWLNIAPKRLVAEFHPSQQK